MKPALSLLLLFSLGLNAYLWFRLDRQSDRSTAVEVHSPESEAKNDTTGNSSTPPVVATSAAEDGDRELLRLRNEVSQLRKSVGEASQWRAQALEAGNLRRDLTTATQELAEAEAEIANLAKLSPADLQQLKNEAHSVRCVNHMKQIALAARIWSNDNNDVFPPDLVTMKNELTTPKILFCPGEAGVAPVSEWEALNPSVITYRYLNAGGSDREPQKLLLTCPYHGHTALSDGSVHRR
ncbi:MAG: hypothetical protein IPK15_01145 [Verrucomicrobia bacterium]|nr:hypothetical protein [Verrucomicrobiota bacterium]